MKRRNHILPPPDDAEYVIGEGIEFKPEHDLVNAAKPLPPPVELTPVGPAPTIYEFLPEHDLVRGNGQPGPPAEDANGSPKPAKEAKKNRKRKKS